MFLIFQLVIEAAVLAGAIYLVGRHEADFHFPKLMLVAFGIAIVGWLVFVGLIFSLGDDEGNVALYIDAAIRLPVVIAVGGFLIHQFLYLRWRDALIASLVYVVVSALIGYLWNILVSA